MRRLAAALCLLLNTAPAWGGDLPLVLFDEAHGQLFLVGGDRALDLSRFADTFRATGARVATTGTPFSDQSLAEASVVVVSGPFAPIGASEQEALLAFLDRGGSLAVMLHIGPPVADLLQRLGISISTGVIRESDGVLSGNPIDFRVSLLARHPLTAGLGGFSVYGAWALLPQLPGHSSLAQTQPHAWIDLNHTDRFDSGDAMQSFTVAVAGQRGGRYVVFGDDAMFQNQFLAAGKDNRRLAENLTAWLLGADGPAVFASLIPAHSAPASR